jgi:hypothetical protein
LFSELDLADIITMTSARKQSGSMGGTAQETLGSEQESTPYEWVRNASDFLISSLILVLVSRSSDVTKLSNGRFVSLSRLEEVCRSHQEQSDVKGIDAFDRYIELVRPLSVC